MKEYNLDCVEATYVFSLPFFKICELVHDQMIEEKGKSNYKIFEFGDVRFTLTCEVIE